MTLPSSGPLAISQIRTEFNGPSPIRMSYFYRGGTYVPNIPANTAVPTSGQVKVSNFYGASRGNVITLIARTNPTNVNSRGYYPQATPPTGSASPTTINGATIVIISDFSASPTSSLSVGLNGNLLQTFWTSLQFTDVNGTPRNLTTSTATFSAGTFSGLTEWTWGFPANTHMFGVGQTYFLTYT